MRRRYGAPGRDHVCMLAHFELSNDPVYAAAYQRLMIFLPRFKCYPSPEVIAKDRATAKAAFKEFNATVGRLVKNARARITRQVRKKAAEQQNIDTH